MATLITGGTSQIGLLIAKRLQKLGREAIFATRSPQKVPSGFKHSKFDWNDATTFEIAFKEHTNIENVYILPPLAVLQPMGSVKPFIDLAVQKGVKKFVVLSASCTPIGGSMGSGLVHEYLEQIGADYLSLRPTWFIENIFNFQVYSIQGQGEIVSVVPDGKLPFVSVEDIAQAAVEFITGLYSAKERIIIGPESYTYDEVAEILKDYVGKPIKHRVLTEQEQIARYTSFGVPEDYTKVLVEEELKTNDGREDRLFEHKDVYVGKHTLKGVLEARKDFWKQ